MGWRLPARCIIALIINAAAWLLCPAAAHFHAGEPAESATLKRALRSIAYDVRGAGTSLASAMEPSWESTSQLLSNPLMAGILRERHRIIAHDRPSASLLPLIPI